MESQVASKVLQLPAPEPSARMRVAVWLPFVALIALAVAAAAGVQASSDADAASTGSVVVTATVGPELTIDMTSCAGPINTFTGGTLSSSAGVQTSTVGCTVGFGTSNNPAGANLVVRDANTYAGSGDWFCKSDGPPDCQANEFFSNPAAPPAATLANGEGGLALTGACANLGGGSQSWLAAGNIWNSVPDNASGDTVANTGAASGTLGTCPFQVGFNASATQITGAYTGTIEFEATAI